MNKLLTVFAASLLCTFAIASDIYVVSNVNLTDTVALGAKYTF